MSGETSRSRRSNHRLSHGDGDTNETVKNVLKKKRIATSHGNVKLSFKNLFNMKLLVNYMNNPHHLVNLIYDVAFNANYLWFVVSLLLPVEFIINMLIVYKIPYTEIDWNAYMQEVEGFLNGTYNYYELKGDTGPLVYPAGFVYIYSLLYSLTQSGINIKLGQYMFIGIYLAFMALVFTIYSRTKRVPPIALALMCLTSHRIHSIFVLRLFNDPIAMLFFYAALLAMLSKKWQLGCILFSLAVSIKMNVLLFAPGLFVLLVLSQGGLFNAFKLIFLCALVQLILGAPFLFTYPVAYIHRSFDLGRQFFYIWTVNWKCIPETLFLAKPFQLTLLALHLIVLVLFLNKKLKKYGGLKTICFGGIRKPVKLNADFVMFIMFISNYIGICFSRSLHYQFYVWYYHTIAYLLWSTSYSTAVRFLLFGLIEMCWNVYPSNFYSSLALNMCHLVLLFGLWKSLDEQHDDQHEHDDHRDHNS